MATDTSRTVVLTVAQRFGLEELLGAQKGKRNDNMVFYRLRQKAKPSAQEKKDWIALQIIIPMQGTTFGIDEEAADRLLKPFELHLESEYVRRLKNLGNEIELTPTIMDWFEPLMEQLESPVEAKKPGPALVEELA